MSNYREELLEQLDMIRKLKKDLERKLAKFQGARNQKILVSRSNGSFQYYISEPKTKKRTYAGKKLAPFIRKQVQYDYEEKLNKKLVSMDKELSRFLKKYDFDCIKEVYDHLPEGKKQLVKPLIPSDLQYIQSWMQEHPGSQNPFPEEGKYLTVKGESVRSKSEKIIADALERHHIPYQYEPLLEISGYHVIYPDFIALNVRTREYFYWEHLGLISDMEYATRNMRKIQGYENSGYLLGKNLIVTMESAESSLQVKLVEEKIKAFLL